MKTGALSTWISAEAGNDASNADYLGLKKARSNYSDSSSETRAPFADYQLINETRSDA